MSTIEYNGELKQNTINSIDNVIDTLSSVNNSFYNTYTPSDYYYYYTFNNIKNNIINIKNGLQKYKNKLNTCAERINKDEIELSSKINKIEDNIIDKF